MKTTYEFEVGDVVTLKSGGPKMTVAAGADEIGEIRCTWFNGLNLSQSEAVSRRFDPKILKPAPLDISGIAASMVWPALKVKKKHRK
jgi:uncharacterized protein YodC (DUF2158 family)